MHRKGHTITQSISYTSCYTHRQAYMALLLAVVRALDHSVAPQHIWHCPQTATPPCRLTDGIKSATLMCYTALMHKFLQHVLTTPNILQSRTKIRSVLSFLYVKMTPLSLQLCQAFHLLSLALDCFAQVDLFIPVFNNPLNHNNNNNNKHICIVQ